MSNIQHNEENIKVLKACIENAQPVLLMGETGTGKTTIVKELAFEESKELVRINLNGQTGREELIGKYILKNNELIWQDGILLLALKKGHWLLLDEINAALPEVLLILQSLLEVKDGLLGHVLLAEKDGELVIPNKKCRIFATANPSDYAGTKDFNNATLSRFVVVNVTTLNEGDEVRLISERHEYDAEKVSEIVRMANELREMFSNKEINTFISTRDLEQLVLLVKRGINLHLATNISIVNKAQSKLERELISDRIKKFITARGSRPIKTYIELEKENAKLEEEVSTLKKQEKNYKELTDLVKKLANLGIKSE